MNTKQLRMKKVRDTIDKNRQRFDYGHYFSDSNYTAVFEVDLANFHTCSTLACVAGWTCAVFADELDEPDEFVDDDVGYVAQMILDLDPDEEHFLFYQYCDSANVDDAIARLDWLIAGNSPKRYDFTGESWWSQCHV